MSMYIASLSRLTMLFNLAVWSTAGKTWGSMTSCWLNNPREKARPIQAQRAPTGASANLSKIREPTDGQKRRRLRETWAESTKYASLYAQKRILTSN